MLRYALKSASSPTLGRLWPSFTRAITSLHHPTSEARQVLTAQVRSYHATSFISKGRLTGANAFDMGYRELSKKQKKRKKRLREVREEKNARKDPAKERIKNEHMQKQYSSTDFQSYIEKMKLRYRFIIVPHTKTATFNTNTLHLPSFHRNSFLFDSIIFRG